MTAASSARQPQQRRASARVHHIPAGRIVAVEHPGIVNNFESGLKSLGGEAQLKHVLEHHVGDSKIGSKQNQLPEPIAGVSLRPHDPLAKRIPSTGVDTRNLLVKVTIPKRTGRKRKRGSDDPFSHPEKAARPTTSVTAPEILRHLRDNVGRYDIELVGMLRETHRFRALPDFQLRNAELSIMRNLRDHTMAPDYDRFKRFNIDMSFAPHGINAFPGPPAFTSIDMPHKYEYQQAASVIFVQDETGNMKTMNYAAPAKRITWGLPPDVDDVPMEAPSDLPMRNMNGEMLPRAIHALQKLLDDRPLVTKRVALNHLPPISDTIFKEATQYVGYSFKAGPWRDSLIKYGVDPRKDSKYRFYQTLMFQADSQAFKASGELIKIGAKPASEHRSQWARPLRHTKDDPTTHVFDGKSITANGKTWQICDLADPVLHRLFHTDNIQAECDVYQWGWFHNGTMSKGRIIMRDKMRYLFAGETPPEEDYRHLVENIPDQLTKANMNEAYLNVSLCGAHAVAMSIEVRNLAKSGENSKSARKFWGVRSGKVLEEEEESEEGNLNDEPELGDVGVDFTTNNAADVEQVGEGDFDNDM